MVCTFVSFCFTLCLPCITGLITFYIFYLFIFTFDMCLNQTIDFKNVSLLHHLDWMFKHRDFPKWGILYPGVQPHLTIHGMPYLGFWNFSPFLAWCIMKCLLLLVTSDFCPFPINLTGSLYWPFLLASKALPVSFVFFIIDLDGRLRKPFLAPKKVYSWRTD